MEKINLGIVITFCENDNPLDNAAHIGFGVDERFVFAMGVSIASICQHNAHRNFVFHVVTAVTLSELSLEKLQQLTRLYHNAMIKVHCIDGSVVAKLPSNAVITAATYNRFFLPNLVAGETDRVLYLDADIICLGNLDELLDVHFDEGEIVGVIADNHNYEQSRRKRLGLKSIYFNAGVLCINIPAWQAFNVMDKCVKYGMSHLDSLILGDQDILNAVLDEKKHFLPERFDFIPTDVFCDVKDVVLLHYAGEKPWNTTVTEPSVLDLFVEMYKTSPWGTNPMPTLSTGHPYSYLRRKAREELSKGNWCSWLRWYTKYLKAKIFATR